LDCEHDLKRQALDKFGHLTVNKTLLGKGILELTHPEEGVVFKDKLNDGLRYLLEHPASKQAALAKKFSKKDLEKFHEISRKAQLNMPAHNSKNRMMSDPAADIYFYDKPSELLNRLEIVMGEISAGNKNPSLKNLGLGCIDLLLRQRYISKAEHKKLFDELTK
jgi:hypothetical protein